MKTSKKIISLLLAVVMVFSATSLATVAAVPAGVNTVEKLIANDNLASLVDWLLANLNGAKANVTGTVLRLVFTFIKNDTLDGFIAGRDVTKLSDAEAAKILLDWLDSQLPELTKDLDFTNISGINVKALVKLLGVDNLDLSSIDNAIGVVYDVCDFADGTILPVGDVKKLNGSALKNVKRAGGDLNVIYALLQWLSDNRGLVASFVKGGVGTSNGLSIGTLFNDILGGSLDKINNIVKNLPTFLKSFVYLLIDGNAKKGDIKKDPAGDWGRSAYKAYTADEMLAAALIRLIEGKKPSETISQSECKEALGLSFYGLLAKYGKDFYAKFALKPLNTSLKDLLGNLRVFEDTAAIFNYDYEFTAATFDSAFANIDSLGVIGQLNNILVTILKTILNPEVFNLVDLKTGSNENLNENFAKACRYVLPILNNHSADLGYDFSKFTAEAVKDMELSEMAAAVLKIFFPGWFEDNYNAELVNSCETVAQLGVAALYFVVTNTEWIDIDNFDIDEFKADITADKIGNLSDDECKNLLANIGIKLGAYALAATAADTHFVFDTTASDFDSYANNIVNWAINFIKGLPAVMVTANVYNSTYGPFYKVNVVLNELINFDFLSDVNDETFSLDVETLIFDAILDNAFNFDLESVFAIFEKNTKAGNILNNGTVITSTISVVDRILNALFVHNCSASSDKFTKEKDCTNDLTGSYCTYNGHYMGTVSTVAADHHNYKVTGVVAATCAKTGTTTYTCTKCSSVKNETIEKTGIHNFVYDADKSTATCTMPGFLVEICSECGTDRKQASKALGHDYNDDGICTRCGAEKSGTDPIVTTTEAPVVTDPIVTTTEPAVTFTKGDVDGNGKIEAADARLALRASVKLENYAEGSKEFLGADVDSNGKIEAADARLILRASVGLEKPETWK